ncbi:MAG: esterase, partial [Sphingobacteriales bacterium]
MLTRTRLFLPGLLFCVATSVSGQAARPPMVNSPEVHADKKVTFRYLAPTARVVKLSAQFAKDQVPMAKDTSGVWSVTVGPIKPDIYPYSFKVDDVTVNDPANAYLFPNERFKASLVDIPADTPLIHAMKNVPHGTVTFEYYPSLDGSTGSVVIYTPPGYEKNNTKRYPVFYLISGTTDTEETFFKVGRTNLILDNLIAAGKATPMIIVMPYGNPAARIAEQKGEAPPADPVPRDGADAANRAKMFETDLLTNIMPFVEKKYRTVNNREGRAIGGFSRGGGQTLRAAFGNVDKFAWVCCYSAYLSTAEMEGRYSHIYKQPEQTNKDYKLLWVSVGNEDFLYNQAVEFMDFL